MAVQLRSITYVSQHTAGIAEREDVVAKIVEDAQRHNSSVGITGALISTRACIAQLIEGPEREITRLMARIEQDRRHSDVTIVRSSIITQRQIPGWALAYSGWAIFVARHVDRLVGCDPAEKSEQIDQLVDLLVQFRRIH